MPIFKNGNKLGKIPIGNFNIGKIIKNNQVIFSTGYWLTKMGYPLTLLYSMGKNLKDYRVYGNSIQSNLPDEYTRLEYIESTGTQYIDTGVAGNSDTIAFEVTIDTTGLSQTVLFPCIIGARTTATSDRLYHIIHGAYVNWYGGKGAAEYNRGGSYSGKNTWSYNINGDKIYKQNDINLATAITESFTTPSLYLLNCHFGTGASTRQMVAKLYSAKIWDNNVLVRNMIPARRNNDNVLGMFDTVNNVFYTNAGTGTFIAGAEITPTPDNPIPVYSLGERTRNLFNSSLIVGSVAASSGTLIGSTTRVRSDDYTVLSAGTYIVSNLDKNVLVRVYDLEGNYILAESSPDWRSGLTWTFTIPETRKCLFCFRFPDNRTITANDVKNIQVEQGTIETDYIPYNAIEVNVSDGTNSTTVTIDLTGHEPLRKIGDVADYIDYANGRIVRNIGKYEITGQENINDSFNNNMYTVWFSPTYKATAEALCECTHYIGGIRDDTPYNQRLNSCFVEQRGNNIYISLGKNSLATTTEFKTWLQNNHVTVYYQLIEPDTSERITLPSIPTAKNTNILTANDAELESTNLQAEFKAKQNY